MNKVVDSDEALMAKVALGHRESLTTLVRRYASPLLTFIQRMIGDRHRGEELLQEVLLRVWVKRRRYTFPRPFRAWLFAIAANCCRADFRRAQPAPIHLADGIAQLPSSADPSPTDTLVATETARLVSQAVGRLPTRQRSVVVLRVWNGLSYAEIARIIGCTEGTARTHMHHGLAGMKEYLEPRM